MIWPKPVVKNFGLLDNYVLLLWSEEIGVVKFINLKCLLKMPYEMEEMEPLTIEGFSFPLFNREGDSQFWLMVNTNYETLKMSLYLVQNPGGHLKIEL